MADEILAYYEKELAYIRQQGARFAEEHPKIAGRLGISADVIEDPHVSRLIEGVAYLNARLHHKLDDDFSEISDALLNVVYPHYQKPIPSCSIVQFVPHEGQLQAKYKVPARTLLETPQFQGEKCRFTTVYETELLPVTVQEAKMLGRPFATPGANQVRGANSVLHLRLKTFDNTIKICEFSPDCFRFFLKGQDQYVNPLYELLLNETLSVVLAKTGAEVTPQYLPKNSIAPVGFNESEGLFPYPASSSVGYRLLSEFFSFPEKFLFFDINGCRDYLKDYQEELNIYIYLKSTSSDLERHLSSANFLLGCTPAVNLFPHQVEPIQVNHKTTEYPVIPDVRRPTGYEVYSIDEVVGLSSTGVKHKFPPLYGLKHQQVDLKHQSYWSMHRRHAKQGLGLRDEATDVYLSLADLNLNPNLPSDKTLLIKATCSNRNLPEKLPFNADQPVLQCVEGSPPCRRIKCLTQPTRSLRPPMGNGARWRLISHLNLNQLSLMGTGDALEALKEILRLYDFKDSPTTRAIIDSLTDLSIRPASAPITIDGKIAMCRGFEINVTIDDSQLSGSSSYLLVTLLEYFFALYCSMNSFTRLIAKRKNKEGFLKKCSPRSGEKVIL